MPWLQAGVAAVGFLVLLAPHARGQGAVAFQPVPGVFPEGAMMSVTPVVSADRRYVRLGINPEFTALNSFATLEVPGAVSGGTVGGLPAGLAGLNGPGAGGPARPAPAGLNAVSASGPIGGRSTSDGFQNALAHYADTPAAGRTPAPEPRKAKAAVPKRGARRREIIRKRP